MRLNIYSMELSRYGVDRATGAKSSHKIKYWGTLAVYNVVEASRGGWSDEQEC